MSEGQRVSGAMTGSNFALFDTAVGECGITWNERGIIGVQLPDRPTRTRMVRRYPDAVETAPPEHISHVIGEIVALLRGEKRDLSDATLDMSDVPEFRRRVYAIARAIPPGATLSYGDIATRLGDRALARDVGEAMGRNPFPIIVPCHRVLAAGGKLGGFSAYGGIATKVRMLEIEGAQVGETPTLFDSLPLAAAPRRRR